jgi:hypothetical protein
MDGIVARERELTAIERLLATAGQGAAAVVLEGEPGIGKSTLWQAACQQAARQSFQVLSCRPVEAEAKLVFASLADLLAPIVDGLLPRAARAAARRARGCAAACGTAARASRSASCRDGRILAASPLCGRR